VAQTPSLTKVSKSTVLLVTSLAGFVTPFIASSINLALPSIGKEFSMDAVMLGWIATAYLLTAVVFLVPLGRLADMYGRKKLFLWGTVIFTFASCLSALSWSSAVLIISRVIQGIGSAMIFGTGTAMLTSAFPPGERGRAMGINLAAVYIGLSLGPFIGGLLTQYSGWRSIFWLNSAVGLVAVVATLWKLRAEWADARGEKFDLIGSVIYGLGIIAVIYGFASLPDIWGIGWAAIGVIVIIVFVIWERRVPSPVLDVRLFGNNRVFAFSNLAAFISYSATFAVAFLLSLYLQYIRGLEPRDAGLILVTMPVIQAIFSPLTGRLSDRIEPQVLASAGMGLTAAGLLLLFFLDANTALWFILASLILLGYGFSLFSSPNTNAIMSSVEKRLLGVAAATLSTMRLSGQMFSLGIAMLLIAVYVGRVQITPDNYPQFLMSIKVAFGIFTLLCFGGIFASLARGKSRQVAGRLHE